MNKHFDKSLPILLLNSHHDTVKPNAGYTHDPFTALEQDGKLYGLGSNDAGGCLVSLIATFLYFYDRKGMKYNIVLAATAEEEISGANGISLLAARTGQDSAGNRRRAHANEYGCCRAGLMVADCTSTGISGHAARDEGDNALYHAMDDIQWFPQLQLPQSVAVAGAGKDERDHDQCRNTA